MHTNQAGLALIKQFEGLRYNVYNDIGGKATIGRGHLIKPGEKFTTLTLPEIESLFAIDVTDAENVINKLVTVILNDNQFSALVSFVFNIGAADFKASTLLQYINQQRFLDVPEQILRWHRMGKKPNKGLISRRAAEAMLFIG